MANIIPIKTYLKAKIIQSFKQLSFLVTTQMSQIFKSQQHVPADSEKMLLLLFIISE